MHEKNLMNTKPYYCYILWSDIGHKFYIGITENIEIRLSQHNTGISKWTKRYAGTWKLVWTREFPSLSDARKFENRLKKQKGGKGFWSITQLNKDDFGS